MKELIKHHPELAGLLIGMTDAVFRAIAAIVFDPSEGRAYGPLLIGNVYHHNEIRAFGLSTMTWFGISAVVIVLMYTSVRFAEHLAKPGNAGFLLSRGLIGAVAGVLVLNVLESLATQKVTNYIGVIYGSRFTAINFGDLLLWISLASLVPALGVAFALYLRDYLRTS